MEPKVYATRCSFSWPENVFLLYKNWLRLWLRKNNCSIFTFFKNVSYESSFRNARKSLETNLFGRFLWMKQFQASTLIRFALSTFADFLHTCVTLLACIVQTLIHRFPILHSHIDWLFDSQQDYAFIPIMDPLWINVSRMSNVKWNTSSTSSLEWIGLPEVVIIIKHTIGVMVPTKHYNAWQREKNV